MNTEERNKKLEKKLHDLGVEIEELAKIVVGLVRAVTNFSEAFYNMFPEKKFEISDEIESNRTDEVDDD